ncbi:MAG TPA: hypothetical protein DDW97_00950 [Anaerolineaceae bacterium]|nr:hypothetical protein [Anaerolineaceae bacterium]
MVFSISNSLLQVTVTSVLETLSQIFTAGVAITAIALLMYSSGFNLKDKLARTFVIVMAALALMFTTETIANISNSPELIQLWLQIRWAAMAMLPAATFHFSDALLTITGWPSRGRRTWMVRIFYFIALVWIALIPAGITVGSLAPQESPMPYLLRTDATRFFDLYYLLVNGLSFYNLGRAVRRSNTTTTRRRLMYLCVGTIAPAVISILFLLHGSQLFYRNPDFFWILNLIGSIITVVSLMAMAYVVSFFGFNWTDRAIKSRLFRWLMRGPFVAVVTLGMTTVVRRYGELYGNPYSPYVPVVMIATIMLLEYVITLVAPAMEKALFFGADREDLSLIRNLEERMLTEKDLDQFLEIITASICDQLQVPGAFIAVLEGNTVRYIIHAGDRHVLDHLPVSDELIQKIHHSPEEAREIYHLDSFGLIPLEYQLDEQGQYRLFGICGFPLEADQEFEPEQLNAVHLLAERATLALKDRALQVQVLESLSTLQPEVDYIQELIASASYNQRGLYRNGAPHVPPEFVDWVKDALSHYWGGPKLTNSSLLELKVVQAESESHDGSRTNALRALLKQAIEQTRPEGERKYTSDWILYNILDLKFIQGEKVREVARKLSVSEADLYRKQRVALESVAQNLMKMEAEAASADVKPTPETQMDQDQ